MATPEQVLAALSAKSESFIDAGNLEVRRYRRYNIREALQPFVDPQPTLDVDTGETIPLPPIETASGKGSPSKRQGTSMAEFAADALGGARRSMSKTDWLAILCVLNVDDDAVERIKAKLYRKGQVDQARTKDWPASVPRYPCKCGRAATPDYLVDLVNLVVIEQHAPSAFRANHHRAEWLGVSERTYKRHLVRPHSFLADQLNTWFESGIGFICRQLAAMRHTHNPDRDK